MTNVELSESLTVDLRLAVMTRRDIEEAMPDADELPQSWHDAVAAEARAIAGLRRIARRLDALEAQR